MLSRIICSYTFTTGQVFGCDMRKWPKNCMFLLISYGCKVEQPDILQHNGMTNSEM